MVETSGASTIKLATPQTTEVITDTACSNTWFLWTLGHIIRMGRDGTTPGNCNVSVGPPQVNYPVLIGGTTMYPACGLRGSLVVINKQKSTYQSVSRNIQKFDASVDGILANDRGSTSIFSKVLGREFSNSLYADIYLRCPMDLTSNDIGTEAPGLVNYGLLVVQHIKWIQQIWCPLYQNHNISGWTLLVCAGSFLEKLQRLEWAGKGQN